MDGDCLDALHDDDDDVCANSTVTQFTGVLNVMRHKRSTLSTVVIRHYRSIRRNYENKITIKA